jgi:hypothetical protein
VWRWIADPAVTESGIDVLPSGAQLIRRMTLHVPLTAFSRGRAGPGIGADRGTVGQPPADAGPGR